MASQGAKRKRDDLEDLSESGTSGSSFKLSGSEEDTDSSTENLTFKSDAGSSVNLKKRKIDHQDDERSKQPKGKVNQLEESACNSQRHKEDLSSSSTKKPTKCSDKTDKSKDPGIPQRKSSKKVSQTKSNVNQHIRVPGSIRYDRKVIDQACNRLREGASLETVAQEFGVTKDIVSKWRWYYIPEDERKEMIRKTVKEKLSPILDNETVLEACKLMKQGASTISLAKRFGVHRDTIFNWRKKFAPETVRNGRYFSPCSDETVLKVCKELKKGALKKTIASKMGIQRDTVRDWQQKYLLAKYQESTPEGTWEYDRYTKLEVCNRLRQGQLIETIAEELDLHISVVRKWKSENIVTIVAKPVDGPKHDRHFILNVCNRLQKGESESSIAKSLGISMGLVDSWKRMYCTSEEQQPTDGLKHSKDTILRAVTLLKSGEHVNDVARKLQISRPTISEWKAKYIRRKGRKLNTFSTVLYLTRKFYCKRLVLKAYKLRKQGDSIISIARKLKIKRQLLGKWQWKYFQRKAVTEEDLNKIQQMREHFTMGDRTIDISIKFGVEHRTVDLWRLKYLEEIASRFLDKMNSNGISKDVKLKSLPVVVLKEDQKIDELCRVMNFRTRRFIDKQLIEQACKRLRDGVSSRIIAEEFGVLESRVAWWRYRILPEEKRRPKNKYRGIINEACKLIKQGATTTFLAKRYGVYPATVSSWRHKYAPETLRSMDFRSNEAIRTVCRELKSGSSANSVALKMGLAFGKVIRYQKRYLTKVLRETTVEGSWEYDLYSKIEAFEQIRKGVAAEVIARNLGVNVNLVRKWRIDRAKIKRRRRLKFKFDVSEVEGHNSSLSKCKSSKERKLAKIFVPLRKVYIPNRMKLKFVKMVQDGVPVEKLSKDLNVHELTINSWILNQNLLMKSNVEL